MPHTSEAEFQKWITDRCDERGVDWWHVTDSRTMNAGLPDLVLLGPGGFAFVEVKAPKGILRDEQRRVHNLLTMVGVACYLFAPGDEAQVLALLDTLAPQDAPGRSADARMGNRCHETLAAAPAPAQPQDQRVRELVAEGHGQLAAERIAAGEELDRARRERMRA